MADDSVYNDPHALRATAGGFSTPVVVVKPWGKEELLILTDRYAAKILTIEPGHRLSIQYHERKTETLLCVEGSGWAFLGTRDAPDKLEKHAFTPGMVLHITPGMVHTYEATTTMRIFEVSTPEIDDVVRLQDRYGRAEEFND